MYFYSICFLRLFVDHKCCTKFPIRSCDILILCVQLCFGKICCNVRMCHAVSWALFIWLFPLIPQHFLRGLSCYWKHTKVLCSHEVIQQFVDIHSSTIFDSDICHLKTSTWLLSNITTPQDGRWQNIFIERINSKH